MKAFDSGVKYYTQAYAVVEVHFPEDDICCARCRMYSKGSDRCLLDQNIRPYNPNKYVGEGCPLILKENQDERV